MPANGLLTVRELLVCAAALIAAMGASSWLLLRWDREARRLSARLSEFATPYARTQAIGEMGRRRVSRSSVQRLRATLVRLFGYQPNRAIYYPVKSPFVVVGALFVAVIAGQLLAGLAGPIARLGIPLFWIVGCRKAFASFERRRVKRLYVQFPDALGMIVRSVRVGIPVSEAFRNVSVEALQPTREEFALLSDQVAIGIPLDEALRSTAERNQLPEYRFFATAVALQSQTGGGLSETLENLADVIRKRVAVRNRAHAMASEARTSTYILGALPVLTGCVVGALNPKYVGLLFTDASGKAVLAAAVVMLTSGMMIMRAIISRSLR